ncbi:MAG: SCO family protein [Pseudomonadota bacterium]
MKRRLFLSALTLGAAVTPHAARAGDAATFHAIDITGSAIGPDFQLSRSDGRPASMADFKGQYVMLFFGFTQCPDVCPTALSRAVDIRKLLGKDGARVQVLFITVDPERDSAALLTEYMRAFDPSFLGLRGSAAQTAKAAADFKIFYRKVASGSSYTMDHTAITYVADAQGKIRLAMKHDQTAQQCAADLRTLMRADSGAGFWTGLFQ